MLEPEILVVLPTLGERKDLLQQALESFIIAGREVRARLVVVVPYQKPEIEEFVKAYGGEVIADPGRGMAAAINEGLSKRRSEDYYIWFGDDDLQSPGGLGALRDLMEKFPLAPIAFGGCTYIDDVGNVLFRNRFQLIAQPLLRIGPNLIPHMSALMRIEDVLAVGGYDESLKYAMDLDLFLRLRARGRFVYTRREVSAFRWHSDSLTAGSLVESFREARRVRRRYLGPIGALFETLVAVPLETAYRLFALILRAKRR